METLTAPRQIAKAVLDVLAGVPLERAAARAGMRLADLADAAELYQAAGIAALEAHADDSRGWHQVRIQFADWDSAELTAATVLAPYLDQAHDAGVLDAWWFIRKYPCWRVRCRPDPSTFADTVEAFGAFLDGLAAAGLVEQWREGIYELEELAFGGPAGMGIAHELFHADSRHLLRYVRDQDPAAASGRAIGWRELSLLLCGALMRGAGQEWHEQADVWHRVGRMRPLPAEVPTDRLPELGGGLLQLMSVDAGPDGALFGADGPLAFASDWAAAFRHAGQRLGAEAAEGTLSRGVRDILAHHVIFHWNRVGLPATTQAILARAARDTMINPPDAPPGEG